MIQISHIIAHTLIGYISILPKRSGKSIYALLHHRLLTLLTNETIHYQHTGYRGIHPQPVFIDEAVEWDNVPGKPHHLQGTLRMVQTPWNKEGYFGSPRGTR